MVDKEVIRKRLKRLDEHLSVLEDLRKYTLEEFIDEPERYGSTERFLHLSIEILLDMGNHVVADLQLGSVDSYRDVPRLLHTNGYIDEGTEEKWVGMVGFRNVLAHEYLDVDRKIVHEILQNRLEDLKTLQKVFAQFL